jgi:hypothetical protein
MSSIISVKKEKQEEERDELIRIEENTIEASRKKQKQDDKEAEEFRKNKIKIIQKKLENGEDTLAILDATESLNKIEPQIETQVIISNNQEIDDRVENYIFEEVKIPNFGPEVPENLTGYFGAIRSPGSRQLAAGFTIELGLKRALTDAFSCLAWRPTLEAETLLATTTDKMEY